MAKRLVREGMESTNGDVGKSVSSSKDSNPSKGYFSDAIRISHECRKDDDTYDFSGLSTLWSSQEWWQAQVDVTQLAIRQSEEYIKDASRGYSEHMKNKNRTKADIFSSYIDEENRRLQSYREWEDFCVGEFRRINLRKRLDGRGA